MSSTSKNLCWCKRYLKAFQCFGAYLRARYSALISSSSVGAWGERRAARHVRSRGLVLLKRNWRNGGREADIIACDGRTLVVIEVKTRHESLRERYPARGAVTMQKRVRLEHLARSFERNNGPLFRRFAIKRIRIETYEVYYQRNAAGLPWVAAMSFHRT